jgi:hypothetical protein
MASVGTRVEKVFAWELDGKFRKDLGQDSLTRNFVASKVKHKCNAYTTHYVVITASRRVGCTENVKSESTQNVQAYWGVKN